MSGKSGGVPPAVSPALCVSAPSVSGSAAARIDEWRVARYAAELALQGEDGEDVTIEWMVGGRLLDAVGEVLDLVDKVHAAMLALERVAALEEVVRTPPPEFAPAPRETAEAVDGLTRSTRELLQAMERPNHPAYALLEAAEAVQTRGKLTQAERRRLRMWLEE